MPFIETRQALLEIAKDKNRGFYHQRKAVYGLKSHKHEPEVKALLEEIKYDFDRDKRVRDAAKELLN